MKHHPTEIEKADDNSWSTNFHNDGLVAQNWPDNCLSHTLMATKVTRPFDVRLFLWGNIRQILVILRISISSNSRRIATSNYSSSDKRYACWRAPDMDYRLDVCCAFQRRSHWMPVIWCIKLLHQRYYKCIYETCWLNRYCKYGIWNRKILFEMTSTWIE